MRILALETSAKAVSAAVTENGRVLAYTYQNIGQTHSVTLMPMVDAMLQSAALKAEDMDCIAVANGPGSFTGLRIGVSAAKGLAWALEKPCCGVSTLAAMAQNVRLHEGLVICAMDARRSQIYNAVFSCHDGVLTRLTPDRAISLEQLWDEIKNDEKKKIIVGDGAALCYNDLMGRGVDCAMAPAQQIMQNAAGVALAAEEMAERGETVSAQALTPVYLRLSQAERERLARGLPITLEEVRS